MPFAITDDGVRLHYEETGAGAPLIFVHEVAGDHRIWKAQMRHFGRQYRAIAYAARGYPPSDVPESAISYSQARADDILAVLDHAARAGFEVRGGRAGLLRARAARCGLTLPP